VNRKTNVMFMQSQSYFGSDSMIHSLFLRYLDRRAFDVHAACNYGTRGRASAALRALESIPNLHLRPTYFGPSVFFRSKVDVARDAFRGAVPTALSLAELSRYCKREHIDIIHCTEKPRDAFYGYLIARAIGARCVIHLHVKAERWISPAVRWAMRHADALIGVSSFVAQSIVAMGFSPARTFHIVNSLDADGWDPSLDGDPIRREFGVAPETPLLAIISRLYHWKGHTELLKALARVREQRDRFKLLIVGEDDPRVAPERGSYVAELKTLTHELGLDDQVIFTGFRSDISQILAAADIYAMPSFEEPCAVAYLEAMAMEKPVIALDSGGTPEMVRQGQDGLLSAPWDIDGLAANILTLLNDPALCRAMGRSGRERVLQYLNPRRMSGELEQVYRQILGAQGTQAQAVALSS